MNLQGLCYEILIFNSVISYRQIFLSGLYFQIKHRLYSFLLAESYSSTGEQYFLKSLEESDLLSCFLISGLHVLQPSF
jgi:hypothetical protein